VSSGKSVAIMSNSSAHDTELNMLMRSTKNAAWEGVCLCCCGWLMNFLMDSCMLLMMKSIPFGTPMA